MEASFGRKASLYVIRPASGGGVTSSIPEDIIDLSELHFRFETSQADSESPNNCTIRIFNLSNGERQSTVQSIIKGEYSRVVLQAGYENSFGVIFIGHAEVVAEVPISGKEVEVGVS